MADKTLINTIAIILAAGVVITGIIAALDHNSGEEQTRTVTVTGEALRQVSPDQVEIRFSVVTEEDTAQLAGSENARIADAVVQALREYGEVETMNYRVDPVRDYAYRLDDEKRDLTIQFYRATNTVRVTIDDVERAGEALDAGLGAGANDVDNVQFTLSDALRSRVRTELLAEAGDNAEEKADAMASGLGVSLGSIQSVSEGNVYFPSARYYAMDAVMESAAGAPTPISPSDVEVTASVNVAYQIR